MLWPIVLAGAIYEFRAELRGLLARLRRVGATGAEYLAEVSIAAQITAVLVDQGVESGGAQRGFSLTTSALVSKLCVPELNAREPG